jgi:hypothetical protein
MSLICVHLAPRPQVVRHTPHATVLLKMTQSTFSGPPWPPRTAVVLRCACMPGRGTRPPTAAMSRVLSHWTSAHARKSYTNLPSLLRLSSDFAPPACHIPAVKPTERVSRGRARRRWTVSTVPWGLGRALARQETDGAAGGRSRHGAPVVAEPTRGSAPQTVVLVRSAQFYGSHRVNSINEGGTTPKGMACGNIGFPAA